MTQEHHAHPAEDHNQLITERREKLKGLRERLQAAAPR
jgi:hypothetical protein